MDGEHDAVKDVNVGNSDNDAHDVAVQCVPNTSHRGDKVQPDVSHISSQTSSIRPILSLGIENTILRNRLTLQENGPTADNPVCTKRPHTT